MTRRSGFGVFEKIKLLIEGAEAAERKICRKDDGRRFRDGSILVKGYFMDNKTIDKKDKIKKAVAVKYDLGDTAPKVVAKGKGLIAEKILEAAESADVEVYEDANLAAALLNVDIGEHIPPELYEVVAQILIFVGDLDRLEGYRQDMERT